MQRLFSELQRRKVLRVAAAYVVASWIMLQVAASLESALSLPAWFDTVVFSFVVVGFPIALVASWFFEFTPEGIKRTVASGNGALLRPGASDWVLVGLLVVVLGVAIIGPLSRQPSAPTPTATTPSAPTETKQAEAPAAPAVPDASVAVLPFENLSSDKE